MGFFDKFKTKKQENSMYLYSVEELKQFDQFIRSNFGDYSDVMHEVYSPDIHLDIIVIPPTEENNYYKLITMGMGAYKMKVPSEFKNKEIERAELVIYLPPTWNIKSSDEKDYWPIRCLKSVARLPIQCNTWLGFGHTISSDEKNTPYAENTKFCSVLLLSALNDRFEDMELRLGKKEKINFYQLFPLYKEELEFKFENGMAELCDLIGEEDAFPLVNINRKNSCKK